MATIPSIHYEVDGEVAGVESEQLYYNFNDGEAFVVLSINEDSGRVLTVSCNAGSTFHYDYEFVDGPDCVPIKQDHRL